MRFAEADTPDGSDPPEPAGAAIESPSATGELRSGLTVSTVTEAAWEASRRPTEPAPSAPVTSEQPAGQELEQGAVEQSAEPPGKRGLVVSAVRDAMSAQSSAAVNIETSPAPPADPANATSPTTPPTDDPEPRRIRMRPVLSALAAILTVVYGTTLAWAVPLIGTAGFNPWPMYLGMAVAGAVALAVLRPPRPVALWLSALFWVCWISTIPLGALWSPDTKATANAQASVYASALAMLALVGLGLARPAAVRWLWLSVVLTTLPLAVREAVFGDYLYPWHGVIGAPVAVFVNPNNYATILVLMVGIALGWMTEPVSRAARWALGALSVVCIWLVFATTSRAALAALVIAVAASALLAAERGGVRHRATDALRAAAHRRPRTWAAFTALFAVAAAALLLGQLLPGDEATLRSDSLRARFVTFALERWREHPWFGTGAGTFESLWTATPGTSRPSVPPHNGFVEILSENGLVAALPLAALLAVLTWQAARPLIAAIVRFIARLSPEPPAGPGATDDAAAPVRPGPATAPTAPTATPVTATPTPASPRSTGLDAVGSRHLLGMHLLTFVLAGVVISSPLAWFPWWMMLAGAVITAASRPRLRRAPGCRATPSPIT